MNAVAILPTHNRSATLKETIRSLKAQTVPVRILVALDNCTDDSQRVCLDEGVEFFHTVDNEYRKAGAQGQALARLGPDAEFILFMDDDTVIAPNLVEVGLRFLTRHPDWAAVSSRTDVTPAPAGTGLMGQFLWYLQSAEYEAGGNSRRVGTNGRIMVIAGMCALFRRTALEQAAAANETKTGKRLSFREDNITEDYELTLHLKELGWSVGASMAMHAQTDVPTTVGGLWRQRIRWLRGGVDTLRERGWTKHTRADILQHALFWVSLLLCVVSVVPWLSGQEITLSLLSCLPACVMALSSGYRFRYIKHKRLGHYLVTFTLLPALLWTLFVAVQLSYSYYVSLSGGKKEW